MKIYEITSIKNEEQLDEMLPALLLPSIIAGARIAGPWLVKQGAKIVAQRGAAASVAGTAAKKGAEVVAKGAGKVATGTANTLLKRPIATTAIGGGAYVAKKAGDGIDELVKKGGENIDAIKDQVSAALGGSGFAKVVAFASKYAIPGLAAVAILYGGKKIWDYATKAGEEDPKLATENATMGATASGNVASVANPIAANAKIKRDKNGVPVAPQKKNKDGTAINALDMKNNIMGGKAIKRTQ
jgi:hypothetical protein